MCSHMLRCIYYILVLKGLFLGSGSVLQIFNGLYDSAEIYLCRPHDKYDPRLGQLNSMEKLEYFIDSIAKLKKISKNDFPGYIKLVDSLIRMRFYYGLQNYRFSENYLANLAGKLIWYDMGAKVLPDDILKGRKAFCSQSSIVFQEFLRRKGFQVRSVFLSNHFCTEVLINGRWQFHDVSYKPQLKSLVNLSTEDLLANPKYLEQAYLYTFAEGFRDNLQGTFTPENISYGEINAFAAPRMAIFHKVTGFLSWWGWLVFLGMAGVVKIIMKKN